MLKNAYFLEKDVKNRLSVPNPRWPPANRPPRCYSRLYYYNFVRLISSTKCSLLPSKKEQILHLPNFCSYFSLQILKFLLTGGSNIFLAPGRRVS